MRLFDKIGEIPTKLQVQVGALVANIADKKLFTKTPEGNIIEFGDGIEYGSNSVGRWTKFSDGTLIQSGYASVLYLQDVPNYFGPTSGSMYVGSTEIIYPIPFSIQPVVQVGSAHFNIRSTYTQFQAIDKFRLLGIYFDGNDGLDCSWIAIGRYK